MRVDREGQLCGSLPHLRTYGSTAEHTVVGKPVDYPPAQESDDGTLLPTRDDGSRQRRVGPVGRRTGGVFVGLLFFGVALTTGRSRWSTGLFEAGGSSSVNSDGGLHEHPGIVLAETKETTLPTLDVIASNEYGESDRKALALYGLDMVVEPYRETTIKVQRSSALLAAAGHSRPRFRWLLVRAAHDGAPQNGAEPLIDSQGGYHMTLELNEPGQSYVLVVHQIGADGTVVAEGRATVACKYIRRELRDLTQPDRTAFFKAMKELYTISLSEGKAKYGMGFSNYQRIAAFHNSQTYCYHNGMHFLPAHIAFNLVVERSLQLINPKVSLASWDFMIEARTLGTDWPKSEIFDPDMFGSAFGSHENSYQLSEGWFANISSIYDPDDDLVEPYVDANHNAYGYMTARYNYQDLASVTRTHSFCGMNGEAWFADCDVFIGCFENNDGFADWAACMEDDVHASMHGFLGGGFNCNTDMESFLDEHPEYTRGLLTFAMEFLVANKWSGNDLMRLYNRCDDVCTRGSECGCSCDIDAWQLSDEEVYDYMKPELQILSHRFAGDVYVFVDTDSPTPLGFMKEDGTRLTPDQTILLLRVMMVIGCEPGSIGAMSGGASPSDPIFWVLHPIFEKGLHILQLSPGYRDTYNFDWEDGSCNGSGLHDEVPFTEQVLGFSDGNEKLTNEQLMHLFNPTNGKLPYIYDSFGKWGMCTAWDPCPECTAAVAATSNDNSTAAISAAATVTHHDGKPRGTISAQKVVP